MTREDFVIMVGAPMGVGVFLLGMVGLLFSIPDLAWGVYFFGAVTLTALAGVLFTLAAVGIREAIREARWR